MHILELENLDIGERSILYSGLLLMVKSNSGIGFINNDQGHLAYRGGRSGREDYNALGDSPAHRPIYQMMKSLGVGLADTGDFADSEIVTDWKSFCVIATDAYDKSKEG